MITLVPFYRDLSKNIESESVKEMANSYDYKKSLSYLIKSFQRYNKKDKIEVATDLHTSIDHDCVFRTDLTDMNLMESLTTSNTDYVLNHSGKIILCGSDHLISSSVNKFFDGEYFDIGIYLNGTEVNNTAVLINKHQSNEKLVNDFFKNRLDIYKNFSEDTKSWFGDQRSYTELLQTEKIIHKYLQNKNQKFYQLNGLIIKIFEYGYLVKGCRKGGGLKGDPSNVILIDFKGSERKKHIDDVFRIVMKNS